VAVHGSGKKPWKQKGTGARGPDRLPRVVAWWWRGVRAKTARYTINVPKKVKAWRSAKALSERLLAGDVVVVDELKLANHKNKGFLAGKSWPTIGAKGNAPTLVVTDQVDRNLKLASRNVPNVQVEPADSVNVYELCASRKIVATKARARKTGCAFGAGPMKDPYTVVKDRARHGKGQRPNGSVESISGRGREAREQDRCQTRGRSSCFKVKVLRWNTRMFAARRGGSGPCSLDGHPLEEGDLSPSKRAT